MSKHSSNITWINSKIWHVISSSSRFNVTEHISRALPETPQSTSPSRELQNVREWLIDNKLSLLLGKSGQPVWFGTRCTVGCRIKVTLCWQNLIAGLCHTPRHQPGSVTVAEEVSKSACKIKFLYWRTRQFDTAIKKQKTCYDTNTVSLSLRLLSVAQWFDRHDAGYVK